MIKRLVDHKSAQCHVLVDEDKIVFISYTTVVIQAERVEGKWLLECTGVYSRSTIRQIGWFMREYFPEMGYHDMKAIAGTGKQTEYGRKVA